MENKPLKKLFITDDDPDILFICKYCLKNRPDIELTCLDSGEDTLKTALLSPPDMMLIDVMMPGMSGADLIKAIQLVPVLAHIPIVLFTAKVQKNEIAEYSKLGVVDIITKPFNPVLFVDTLQKIWDAHQKQVEKEGRE